MLTFDHIWLSRGPRTLLEDVTLTIYAGQRVGIVGRNGTGKSSLFALIRGELAPDRGELSLPRRLTIASVAQETPAIQRPAIEFVLDGDAELRATERALAEAEAAADPARIAALHERLHTLGGYAARARAGRLLHGLGFPADTHERPVAEFSGGWRERLNLAAALMRRADLLLLDEPTNHLDLDAVIWLQDHLAAYQGTLLVISHDREFLDAVTTHTVHLADRRATLYPGNYSQFERLRAERLAQQTALAKRQQSQIAHLQAFVDRFRAKATKARQAQSRLRMIERIERVLPAHADSPFEFSFAPPDRLPAPLVKLDRVAAGYGAKPVWEGARMDIGPGARIGLLGPNGAGKSTLMRVLAGELEPLAGEMLRHRDLRVGYLAQHQLEQLDVSATPFLHLRRLDPDLDEQSARTFLGGFDFRGDRVYDPVGVFSGGEKARLALALVVYSRPNLLLLDEPTNHLDLELRAALELALQDFAGALVLVSHDRHLLGAACDELWRVAEGTVQPFDGDLDDYAAWLSSRERAWAARTEAGGEGDGATSGKGGAPQAPSAKDRRRAAAEQRSREKPLRDAIARAESALAAAQARLAKIEARLAEPDLYDGAHKNELSALLEEQGRLRREVAATEASWLAAMTEIESLR
jgi:ATP-binding cassette subfamily F protein 3